MGTIRAFLSLAAIVSLPACAPTVWERPGTTPAEFSGDVEQCRSIAEATGRCMISKGYVADALGPPRGSRTLTARSVETASLTGNAGIVFYRGASATDLLQLVNRDRLDKSHALAEGAGALSDTAPRIDLLADIETGALWRRWFSSSWWL